jgi:hypothetical protein
VIPGKTPLANAEISRKRAVLKPRPRARTTIIVAVVPGWRRH